MKIRDVLGFVPFVGIYIGAKRIADARDKKVGDTAKLAINPNYSKKKEIFRGTCEIVPVLGPVVYGISKLGRRIFGKSEKITPLAEDPIEVGYINKLSEGRLNRYLGKSIMMEVGQHAEVPFYKRAIEGNVTMLIYGTLSSIKEVEEGFEVVMKNGRLRGETFEEKKLYILK